MPDFLDHYFWLMCGVWVGGLGGVSYYFKLSNAVATNALTNEARLRFVRGWIMAFMVPSTIFWLLQTSTGAAVSPDYLRWPNPQRWLAITVNVTCWIALLWWVWLAEGAQKLCDMYSLTSRGQRKLPFGAIGIKILSLITVTAGVMALTQNL